MKKVLIAAVILLMLSPQVTASEFPVLDKQVEIRQAHLAWIIAAQEIRMEAALEYISDISGGQGISTLEDLISDLQEQKEKIQTLTTHVALNTAILQFKQIIADFKEELHTQMDTYQGKILVLLNQIQTALESNATMLSTLEDSYWTIRQTNELWIFDYRVANAQTIINTLTSRGYNTTHAQAKLDEIQDKRSDLQAAYEARNQNQIHSVNLQIIALSKELRTIVKNLQIQIPQEKIIQYWIHVGERAVNRTATIISELETLGIDVIVLQQIHSQAEINLDSAKEAFNAIDMQGAIDALHELKANLANLKDAFYDLVINGKVTGNSKTLCEQTQIALDDTIDGLESIN